MLAWYNDLPLVDIAGSFYRVTTVKEYMDKYRACLPNMPTLSFSLFLGTAMLPITSLGSHGDGYGGMSYTYSTFDDWPTSKVSPNETLYILEDSSEGSVTVS